MSNEVYLNEICRPKQWETIPITSLTKEGYPVYGANGVIGFYKEYNHEKPTLLITCRGATCGELNICQPFSYVTGNAMALDDLNEKQADLNFLYYALKRRGFQDVISGTAQPQITREGLSNVKLSLSDSLLQSVFLEMFGNVVRDEKGWEKAAISDLGKVQTGNTPSRDEPENYGNFIEWIKSDNIRDEQLYVFDYLYRWKFGPHWRHIAN
jgi:type I restriction enzyme S subunit